MMVTLEEIDVTGVDALSVALKVRTLPPTTGGAVGVPESTPVLPVRVMPAGSVPEFSE